jgi:hypothetical protein
MKATEAQKAAFDTQMEILWRKFYLHLNQYRSNIHQVFREHDFKSVEVWETEFFVDLANDGFYKWMKQFYDANKTEMCTNEDSIQDQIDEILKKPKP